MMMSQGGDQRFRSVDGVVEMRQNFVLGISARIFERDVQVLFVLYQLEPGSG